MTLSGCGHFAVIGMSGGHLEVFNMQSGLHRGEFGKPKGIQWCFFDHTKGFKLHHNINENYPSKVQASTRT